MPNKSGIFDKSGGYRKLRVFTFATMIHLETIRFCRRFLPWKEDPLGKTAGQMIGAARSGRQNIIEGSERSATSKETEMKLTDVARASLAELLGDYEIYLAEKGAIPWSKNDPERIAFGAIMLPEFQHTDDSLHDYWNYYHKVRPDFAPWLDRDDDEVVANAMIVLIQRAMSMLSKQMRRQGETFVENGGFCERMYQMRVDARENATPSEPDAPECPECGRPMRHRSAKAGKNAGKDFWGCSAYPACKGTREITK